MMKTTKMMTIWKKFLLLGCFFGVSVNGLWGVKPKKGAEITPPQAKFDVSEDILENPSAADAVLASVTYGILKVMEVADGNFISNLKTRAKFIAGKGNIGSKLKNFLENINVDTEEGKLKFALGLAALFVGFDPEAKKSDDQKFFDGFVVNIQQALQHAFDVKNALEK